MTRSSARGFTLIEMVAVVAIVGVLVMAARPLLVLQQQRQQEFALREGLRQIRGALDAHKRLADEGRLALRPDDSGWPTSLDVLVQGVVVGTPAAASSPAAGVPARAGAASEATARPQRVYLLRRLPRDPFADPTLPARDTWALRSSDSPPDSPRAGRDVFDIASTSERRALDGSAYRDW